MKLKIKKDILWKIYYVIIFTTELISFRFIGNLRLYYVVGLLYLFPFIPQFKKLIRNQVTGSLLLFIFVLFITSIFSSSFGGALSATISLSLNIITAFVTYFVLCNKKISVSDFFILLEKLMLLCIVFGLITWILSKAGINITFNKVNSFQILNDQIAAFRTEANTHGKLCCYAVAYCVPFLLSKKMDIRKWILLIVSVLTLLISPTRSATYALLMASFIYSLILIKRGFSTRVIKAFLFAIVIVSAIPIVMNTGILSSAGYSMSKLNNFFFTNISDVGNDYSGSFRMESLYAALDIWTSNTKNMILGVGLNQAKVSLQNNSVNTVAAGVEIVGLLVSGGVVTVITWLYVVYISIRKICRITNMNNNPLLHSILICAFYIFIIEIISGDFYVPETWITFGVIACLTKDGDFFNENKCPISR